MLFKLSIVIRKKVCGIRLKITVEIDEMISRISLYKKKLAWTNTIIRILFINSRFAFSRRSGEFPDNINLNPVIKIIMP